MHTVLIGQISTREEIHRTNINNAYLVKSLLALCGRLWFDPWVRKIPWSRKWQLAPGESHRQRSPRQATGPESQRVNN